MVVLLDLEKKIFDVRQREWLTRCKTNVGLQRAVLQVGVFVLAPSGPCRIGF